MGVADMIGDVYINSKTGKKSIVIDIRDEQTMFAIVDNPKRKFMLTPTQMSNMKLHVEETPPPILPTLPKFLEDL